MGTVVDHLLADHEVLVCQPFTDRCGVHVATGTRGVLRRLELDWAKQTLTIEWEREGHRESLQFNLAASGGPRVGRMKDYFELGAYVPRPGLKRDLCQAPSVDQVPDLHEGVISEEHRWEEACRRVWALAARRRFDEAHVQLVAIQQFEGGQEELSRLMAECLGRAAGTHVDDPDPAVYKWIRDQVVGLRYVWGSGATSGGDGTYRARYIREAEAQFTEWERRRT